MSHIEALERNDFRFDDYVASDLEIHGLYYNNLKNEYMKSILNNLKAHSIRVRWLKELKQSNSDQSRISIREHRDILEAMLANDPQAVYDTVHAHIEKSARRLFEVLE